MVCQAQLFYTLFFIFSSVLLVNLLFWLDFWNWVSGQMTEELQNFLERSLPKVKEGKKAKYSLGLAEPKLGSHIHEVTKIPCQSNEFVLEILRGVRLHFEKFIENLKVCFFIHLPNSFSFPLSTFWFSFICLCWLGLQSIIWSLFGINEGTTFCFSLINYIKKKRQGTGTWAW